MTEEERNPEAEEEAEKARKHQKKKRRRERMPLPQVLRYLTGDEVLELLDYLMERHIRWVNEVETLRYTQAFDAMLSRYLEASQQQGQEQQQSGGAGIGEAITQAFQPRNPLDALVLNFVGRIADRVIDYVLSNPRFQQELQDMIKNIVAGMAQAYAQQTVEQAINTTQGQ